MSSAPPTMGPDRVAAAWYVLQVVGADLGVWSGRLPAQLRPDMPGRAIVVRGAGGSGITSGRYLDADDGTVDVRFYGPDEGAAMELAKEGRRVLQTLAGAPTPYGSVQWCRQLGATSQNREPDTEYPLVLTTWRILAI